MRLDSFRSLSILVFASLFPLLPPVIAAQTVSVQNGTTVRLQNAAAWSLEDGTMDFGSSGSTARLDEQGTARVTGGQLTATRVLSSPSSADPAGLGLQVTASENLGEVAVTRGHAIQIASNGNESIRRHYDIFPSQNNNGLSAELTFAYREAELNEIAESELEFFKSEDGGSNWSEEGFDRRDMSANTATLSGIESLSRWTLGSESAPLPVELARFDAHTESGAVRLTWQTATETNNTGFEVQRRVGDDAGKWTQVGFVSSKAEGGTTDQSRAYRFVDEDLPYVAETLEYRLRQIDLDGTSTLTRREAIERPASKFELKPTFPNPAREQATVRFAVPERQEVSLQLYDTLGRVVRILEQGSVEGRRKMQMDLSGLSTGTYFLRLRADGRTETRQVTLVR